ncbi:MAG: hypothetical protein KJ614_10160 [Gammaproteobacteria bacterium]|uniref:hypothetical protein n=1 Tax=Rhodoferax sp. TaxID=50421 RepID=UPI001850FEEF|nr:hypothetical protein [Rhodoferax sp.]MBU3899274.1 hypothetical protein [Gammaproteobacteria bacterium]MBA3058155.1 hypothetical protein [Rhodoferax sp.]MBU3996924.1 hypothetical protein [Gammaproteobacteria bacterium]MBU4081250.1 hypothetical protein [Gammaproteobacteria bacterium]MBU4115261.1 hypothetical protein [Gammaproteobacteria bacterium]
MLDIGVNQGAGLQRMALQAAPRVIAVASHGQQQGELPLLWSLCTTLVDLGHSVAVLDATTLESADNPGLAQLLDDADLQDDDSATPWSVIPAALGLAQLCHPAARPGGPLAPLSELFQRFGVLVIYARAGLLADLLPDSGIEPLLTVAPVKMSAVTAYQALKQMLLNTKLRPTMAAIVGEPSLNTSAPGHSPVANLQHCAMNFLGYRLDALAVRALQPQECRSDDMYRLALRLLENAMPLHRHQCRGSH